MALRNVSCQSCQPYHFPVFTLDREGPCVDPFNRSIWMNKAILLIIFSNLPLLSESLKNPLFIFFMYVVSPSVSIFVYLFNRPTINPFIKGAHIQEMLPGTVGDPENLLNIFRHFSEKLLFFLYCSFEGMLFSYILNGS